MTPSAGCSGSLALLGLSRAALLAVDGVLLAGPFSRERDNHFIVELFEQLERLVRAGAWDLEREREALSLAWVVKGV